MNDRWSTRLSRRPVFRAETLALIAAVGFTLLCNHRFFAALASAFGPTTATTWLRLAAVACALVALQAFLLVLVLTRRTARPLLGLLVVVTAYATYAMNRYGVYLDPDMVRNVLHTDLAEAAELLDWQLFGYPLLFAALPLLLLARIRLAPSSGSGGLLRRTLVAIACLAIAVASLYAVLPSVATFARNQPHARYLATPLNYLWSIGNVLLADADAERSPRIPIGLDAHRGPIGLAPDKPALFVIVVGEAVRAANWGLNGNRRQTTPELAREHDLINFRDVASCGTSTEVALPCLFSPWGRSDYDEARIRRSE